MIHFLTQRFIENYDDYKNQKVRQAYGTLCSILSIICNIVLVIFNLKLKREKITKNKRWGSLRGGANK